MNKYSIDYNFRVLRTKLSPQSLHWRRSPSLREPGHDTNVSLMPSYRVHVKQPIVETRKKHSPKPRYAATTHTPNSLLHQSVEIVNHVIPFDTHTNTHATPHTNTQHTPHTNTHSTPHANTQHTPHSTTNPHTNTQHATINAETLHNRVEDTPDMDFEFVERLIF